MTARLWIVPLSVEMVVLAETEPSARQVARRHAREVTDQLAGGPAIEFGPRTALPCRWEEDSIPYSETDDVRTIAQHRRDAAREQAERAAAEAFARAQLPLFASLDPAPVEK